MALGGLTEVGVLVSISNEDQTTGHGMFRRGNKLFNFLPEPVKVGTFGAPTPAKLRYQRGSETRSDESTRYTLKSTPTAREGLQTEQEVKAGQPFRLDAGMLQSSPTIGGDL